MEEMYTQFGIEVVNYFGSNEGAALTGSPLDIPQPAQRARYFARGGTPERFVDVIRRDVEKWTRVVKTAKVQAER